MKISAIQLQGGSRSHPFDHWLHAFDAQMIMSILAEVKGTRSAFSKLWTFGDGGTEEQEESAIPAVGVKIQKRQFMYFKTS